MKKTARITKTFKFEAAHFLPNHDGKCKNMHGHSYRVDVSVVGPIQDEGSKEGMVQDFSEIKGVWKRQIEPLLDHQCLNETLPFVTTAENIAHWIGQRLLDLGIAVDSVVVWETETSRATVLYSELLRSREL